MCVPLIFLSMFQFLRCREIIQYEYSSLCVLTFVDCHNSTRIFNLSFSSIHMILHPLPPVYRRSSPALSKKKVLALRNRTKKFGTCHPKRVPSPPFGEIGTKIVP